MTRENRETVYQSVTVRIVECLEQGVAPWSIPWVGGGPVNVRNGRPYRGVNTFMLTMVGATKGYADNRWGTYKAIAESGGNVRKGEKSTRVILWKPVGAKETPAGEKSGYLLLTSFAVFNAAQADGVPAPAEVFKHDPLESAEEIVRGYAGVGPLLQFGGVSATYDVGRDLVACPSLDRFTRSEAYYSTLFHELAHSTGHKSRLDRLTRSGYGSSPYAKEELIAEMTAAMLCGIVGIDNHDQSAAYVKGWLDPIGDDPRCVIQAAANAQKAADLILEAGYASVRPTKVAVA